MPGELQVVSRTGGLLAVPKPVDQGSLGTLMFRTHRGLMFATAEMLSPLSWNRQPFRFVDLSEDDLNRLQAAFQSGLYRNIEEEEWIEEFRAAIVNWNPPTRNSFFKPLFASPVLAAATLATLCFSVIYVISALLR
jgi:hypothetical protein